MHPRLNGLVTEKESKLLFSRIMHTFFREYAYMLPTHILVTSWTNIWNIPAP